jgi:16S rRNA (guanine527-N7)-methyltransferase
VSGLVEDARELLAGRGLAEAVPFAEGLALFVERLLGANTAVNLVSRNDADPATLLRRHVLDALEALPELPSPAGRPLRLLDVGSGGGLPAIPLLLVRRDLEGTLVESIGKKARFLEEVVSALGLAARVVPARFPEGARDELGRLGPFDVLTSRAVAAAGGLARGARPFLRSPGAIALFWSSERLLPEIARAVPRAELTFRKSPGADRRGLVRLERFT